MLRLFCKIGDRELGPFSPDELKKMASGGDLAPDDLVRRETDEKWVLARRLKHLTFGSTDGRTKRPSFDVDYEDTKRKRSIKSNPPIVVDVGESKTETGADPRRLVEAWTAAGLSTAAHLSTESPISGVGGRC